MTSKYMNEFVKLSCGPDLLALKIFPNVKEICESLACFHATQRFFPELWPPPQNITVIVVGDGISPRTGAIFAFLSPWKIISVDPMMREKWLRQRKIKRLKCYRKKAENVTIEVDTLIIVSTHGHVPLNKLRSQYKYNTGYMISMPCCQPGYQILPRQTGFMYNDLDVPSDKNLIYGWKL